MSLGTDAGPKAPPGNPQFLLGDAVRAIAIFGVVACHVGAGSIHRLWWATLAWNGQIGVQIFFMLSGFLLYRPYLVARTAGRPLPSTWKFLRRRAIRIVPAYWVALTVLAIWPGLPGVFSSQWWRYYGFLQIYPLGHPTQGLVVAWTLCIEVSFYLLLPVFAAAMAKLASPGGRHRWEHRELAVFACLVLAGLIVRDAIWRGDFPGWTAGTIEFQLDYFLVGMALAVASVAVANAEQKPRWVAPIDRWPGVFFALALATFVLMWRVAPVPLPTIPGLHITSRTPTLLYEEANRWLAASAAFLLMLPVVFGDARRGLSRRLLGTRWVLGTGLVSYGIYLWHDPLLTWLVHENAWNWTPLDAAVNLWLGTVVMTVSIAVLSYRYVERPFLRRRYETRDLRVAPPPESADSPRPAPADVQAIELT